MGEVSNTRIVVDQIVSRYWDSAKREFDSQMLDSYDQEVTLRATQQTYNLKAIYTEGCQGRLDGYLENPYGNYDNPYLRVAYRFGWRDTDLLLRSHRQKG